MSLAASAERAGLALMRHLDPEDAHRRALQALNLRHALGLSPGGPATSATLKRRVWSLDFPNPIGVAAGFDKNAEAVAATLASGPGFLEIGGVAPWPQPGNPRPRLFRLTEDRGVINRFGFNTQGMEAVAARLEATRAKAPLPAPLGLNLGANKDSADKVADYIAVLGRFAGLVDFFVINVSSPNTERLRDLQGRDALATVLSRSLEAREARAPGAPLLVKIAPDLDDGELSDVAEVCLAQGIDGIVATNTTLAREGLSSPQGGETGGLSGQPLFERSTQVLATLSRLTGGALPLVGVGGVASVAQARAKFEAGASLVQMYSGLVYGGLSLAGEIARGLDRG